METKVCKNCRKSKFVLEFYKTRTNSYSTNCKKCESALGCARYKNKSKEERDRIKLEKKKRDDARGLTLLEIRHEQNKIVYSYLKCLYKAGIKFLGAQFFSEKHRKDQLIQYLTLPVWEHLYNRLSKYESKKSDFEIFR